MDSGRPKSFNNEDMNSCRISVLDDDDDEDATDRVGLIDYCLPPKTSSGTVTSSDNCNFSKNTMPYSKMLSWNDNGGLDSYAKDEFERQVAQKDSIDSCRIIDKSKKNWDFDGNQHCEVSKSGNSKELEEVGAREMVLGSVFKADKCSELVRKPNNKFCDEALPCESDEEHEVVGSCCDVDNECRAEYNSIIHDRNTEKFDEALSVNSDEDSADNTDIPKNGYCAVAEPVIHLLNSKPVEVENFDFQVEVPKSEAKAKKNGYDTTGHRNPHSSKYTGSIALTSVDRCNKLLSPYSYMSTIVSTTDSDKSREHLKPFPFSDDESGVDVSCRVGHHANPSDDSDDSSKFCERSSELNILHQPFSELDELSSERGTGDWHCRGNSLQSSTLKRYPTPQYHLTRYERYDFSSEFEQPNVMMNRYHQLQQRRHARRERKDGAVLNSTDVPGYKGNLEVEELLSYINDSKGLGHQPENHGTVETHVIRSAEKAGKKRKKGGPKGREKQDKTGYCCDSANKTPGDAKVGLEIKTNESVKSINKTNCVDAVFCGKKTVIDLSQKQETVRDSVSQGIGHSSLALKETCDILQGSMDSSKTVTFNGQLERSARQHSSSPLLHSTSNDVLLQRAVASEDDFTMVTKKKKAKKISTKRSKLTDNDCLSLCPVSGRSATLSNTAHEFVSPSRTASEELDINCFRTKTRNNASSKVSNSFKPSVDKTVTENSRLYSEEQVEKVGRNAQKKLATFAGKALDVSANVAQQNISTATLQIGESKRNDSVANKLVFRNLSSQGKMTVQNGEKQELEKSLAGAESLLMSVQVTVGASLGNGVKQVAEDKQRLSKEPSIDQSKDLSVEKMEILPLGEMQNLSLHNVAKPEKMSQDEKVVSENLAQDGTDVDRGVSQNEMTLSENTAPSETEMLQKPLQDEMAISKMPAHNDIDASQQLLPDDESLPQKDALDRASLSAQSAAAEGTVLSDLPPSEHPVVFLDRQSGLFSVPAKKDLGLKFGHFDDYNCTPDDSRTSPAPGPINVIHYIPVPYSHEGGQEKLLADTNSLTFPFPHQYVPQLMYANCPVQSLCKPAFQLYPIPMHLAPFVPPGFCVLPHPTNVPVGVVSPTMNNRTREDTSSSESADSVPVNIDGSDSCVASFACMQNGVAPTEPVVQFCLQPVTADVAMANVSPSSSKHCKSAFDVWTAGEFLYSEWLDVIREEKEPNCGVVRYIPDLDV